MTLDELLAIEEIKQLRNGYAAHMDAQEVEALVALFTDDAVCDFGESYGTWRGREEIGRNYKGAMQHIGAPFNGIHVMSNPWIRIKSPTAAVGRWYLTDWAPRQVPDSGLATPTGHNHPLMYLGIYEDDYRKVDGKWLISYTKLHFLWPQSNFTGLRHPGLI
jgi:hypothetical protein